MYVTVGGARFPAHQAVLAALSDWLRTNLKELLMQSGVSPPDTQWPELKLEGISHPDAVLALLDAAYDLGQEPSLSAFLPSGHQLSSPSCVCSVARSESVIPGVRPIPHAALADVLRLSHMFQVRQLEEQAAPSSDVLGAQCRVLAS